MKYLLTILFFSFPALCLSAQPLSKSLVESAYSVSGQIDGIESKYPDVFSEMERFGEFEQEKMIKYLESSRAYPEIKKILNSANLTSMHEVQNIMTRIVGGLNSMQESQVSAEEPLGNMVSSLEANIESMRQQGAPSEVIRSMEGDLKEFQAHQSQIKISVSQVTDEDKKFVRENFDWLMAKISDFDEEMGGDEYADEFMER